MNLLLLAADAAATSSDAEDKWVILGFVLLALAIVFFAAELFLPSGGLLATLCGVTLLGSVLCFFLHDWRWGIVAASIYAAGAPAAIVFGLKVWAVSPLARRMILGNDDTEASVSQPPSTALAAARREQLKRLIGAEGTAVTPLRPVGIVRIQGQRVDALADTGLIDAGARVIVVEVVDEQIRVREAS